MEELETLELTQIVDRASTETPGEPATARWDTQMRSFQARLMRFDRPQSKTVTVRANTEAGARAQAQARAGGDWRIASITAI